MQYSFEKKSDDVKSKMKELYKVLDKTLSKGTDESNFNHLNRDKISNVLYRISTYGWYIDDFKNGKVTNKCLSYLYQDLPEKMDEYLMDHYENKLEEIKNRLNENYPKRKIIFEEAFKVFEEGYYFSCISLLLPQIDGICNDRRSSKFFMQKGKNHLPEVENSLKESASKYSDFLLSPVSKKSAINSHLSDLESFPIRLNRNEILHGIDFSYGSRKNALKVISMVSYIDFTTSYLADNRWIDYKFKN